MQRLNRRQRRQLPAKPTAEEYRRQTTIKLLNRLNNYKEILTITEESHTIRQIKNRIQQRIDATQNYINELNKDNKQHEN